MRERHFTEYRIAGGPATYVVGLAKISDKSWLIKAVRYYRLAFRDIARSNDERTLIFALLAPSVCGNKAPCERSPDSRPNCSALLLLTVANSFVCDWLARLRIAATVNLFLLNATPVPQVSTIRTLLCHSGVRLTCNHAGYTHLWQEQLGRQWRELGRLIAGPCCQTTLHAGISAPRSTPRLPTRTAFLAPNTNMFCPHSATARTRTRPFSASTSSTNSALSA